jgi:formylglycine-generating enzyme required for sulfatase activity
MSPLHPRSTRRCLALASIALLFAAFPSATLGLVTIPTAPVDHAGNVADPSSGYGAVGYRYQIGTTEVTNLQYTQFLNAVAASDPNNLYNPSMGGAGGGIARVGSPGSYAYVSVVARANHPVTFVSFWDAARFANWLHNGQPVGPQSSATTEDGAYTLTPGGISANTVTRNAGWQWAVTSSDEWQKAAYYQPASQGGDSDNYWLYPTSSNTAPTGAQANYLPSGPNDTVPVASYPANFYGAYDMAGNVYEWSDTILAPPVRGPMVGGAYDNIAGWLTSANAYATLPGTEREVVGFRVVAIPAPSAAMLLGAGSAIMLRRRRP